MPGLAILPEVSTSDRKRRATQGEPSVHHRRKRNKFEPRLSVCSGLQGEEKMVRIYLGDYEAEDVFRVAAFYYNWLDRLKDEDILLCLAILPKIPPQLSGEPRASWIRKRAAEFVANKSKSLEAQIQSASPASWDHQGRSCVPGLLQSGGEFAVETNFSKNIAPQYIRSDDNDWGTLGSSPYSYGSLSNDRHLEEDTDCRKFEVCEQGVGSEGLNSFRPCRDGDATCHQEVDAQLDLQPNHPGSFAPEHENVAGLENVVGVSGLENVVTGVSGLEYPDTFYSALKELHDQGWKWKKVEAISDCVSTIMYTCDSSRHQGQTIPNFSMTITIHSVFQEVYKQGWRITLEPNNNATASPQVTTNTVASL